MMWMELKNKHENITSNNKRLSIQFSLDGFSFCIEDIPSNQIISFTSCEFKETKRTPEFLLEEISKAFNENKGLQADFKEVHVIHQNNLSTLVPNTFFDPKELESYLKYTIKTLSNDFISYDDLSSLEAKNVYIPFVNINNYLFQNFGSFEFNHHSTILIDKLITLNANSIHSVFYVQVFKSEINIIVIENGKLLLYNSFEYQTEEDFIYYILFVAEQLEMDTDKFQLTFLGNIDKESPFYKITYKYVRHIDFIKTKSNFFKDSNDFTEHSNYILVS